MKSFKYLLVIIFSLFFINTNLVLAQTTSPAIDLQKQSEAFNKTAGFASSDLGTIISLIIRAVLGLLGIIFLVLIIMAGFKWMTAGGNEQQVKSAQDTMKTAVIGLVIVLAAYSITYFIFNKIPFDMAAPTNITTSG
ncbi:MAG: pilin [Candidatus Falkowbacteria bacterium]|nr:pilin [Candidatus Falkowbacteria bacterium]